MLLDCCFLLLECFLEESDFVMEPIDKRITDFVKKHHLLSLATGNGIDIWCASCFYVYDLESNRFYFSTENETRHGRNLLTSANVAGTIALETLRVGLIQGVQFAGICYEPTAEELSKARSLYLKRFPIARVLETHFWAMSPFILKMTHNQLGFGKKLIWETPSVER